MLHEIQQFGNTAFYTVVLPEEPEKTRNWFRATEVAKFLGYTDPFRAVHAHCKDWQYREFKVGRGRPALYVCESGVYRLILRSKSKFALDFQDWLTEEVLPKLRASGGYIVPTATSEQLEALQQEISVLQEKYAEEKRLRLFAEAEERHAVRTAARLYQIAAAKMKWH